MDKAKGTCDRNLSVYSGLYSDASVGRSYEVRNKVNILTGLRALKAIRGKVVLELGFGSGDLLHRLAASAEESRLVGVEMVKSALRNYDDRFPDDGSVRLVVGDVCRLPFVSGLFDVVVCSHVLEHVEDDSSAVGEIRRVLKSSGVAVVAVPVKCRDEHGLHCRDYDADRLRALFRDHGMECESLDRHGSYLMRALLAVIGSLAGGRCGDGCASGPAGSTTRLREIYHGVVVPCMLAADRVDDLLARLDPEPMQIVGVFGVVSKRIAQQDRVGMSASMGPR